MRRQPFVPNLGIVVFDFRPFRRVDQNAAIGIEQRRIALGQDFQPLAILEIGPGGTIGQRLGVHRSGDIERRAHALAEIAIPPAVRIGLDAGRFPQPKLHAIGAAVIAAARKRRRDPGDLS